MSSTIKILDIKKGHIAQRNFAVFIFISDIAHYKKQKTPNQGLIPLFSP